QLALLDVRLVVADDLVAHLLVGLDIGDVHGGTEDHLAGMRDAGDVDNLSVLQASLDITNARLDHALLLARGMVFGVFLEIAQLARLGDGLGDLRTQHGLQMLEFIFQGASALDGHREFGHDLIPAWSSCKRRTVFSGPNLSASQIAWPPAMVVVMQILCCRALRRMEYEAAIDCRPSVVLMIRVTSSFLIM